MSADPGSDSFETKLEILADSFEWLARLLRAHADSSAPLGMIEIGQLLGVKYNTVQRWRQRGIFPAPDLRVGGSPAWKCSTVVAWAESTGRWSNGEPVCRRR